MTSAFVHMLAFFTVADNRLKDRAGERGATAVEYGLLVGLIAIVIIVAVTLLGTTLSGMFNSASSKLPKA